MAELDTKPIFELIKKRIAEDKNFAGLKFFCKNCRKDKVVQDLLTAQPRMIIVPMVPDGSRMAIRCPECGMEIGVYDHKAPFEPTAK